MYDHEDYKRIAVDVFLEVFREKYCENPFETSGFAHWKTKKAAADGEAFASDRADHERLYIVKDRKLLSYLSDDEELILRSEHDLASFDLINVHSRYVRHLETLKKTHDFHRYRPLSYVGDRIEPDDYTPEEIVLRLLDTSRDHEISAIAEVISRSTGSPMRSDTVTSWKNEPVFDKRFWIAAVDQKTDTVVGVGISTYDEETWETDLDWFYVIPEYQRRGIGTALVKETLRRCMQTSIIIRVAGVADGFYEKCGFRKQDEWYFIVRRNKKVSWWDD